MASDATLESWDQKIPHNWHLERGGSLQTDKTATNGARARTSFKRVVSGVSKVRQNRLAFLQFPAIRFVGVSIDISVRIRNSFS